MTSPTPLRGIRLVTVGVNIPVDVAGERLARLGAQVAKVEPPGGDPLKIECAQWYEELVRGQEVLELDLKEPEQRLALDRLLSTADLLLTSNRPRALERLGLDPDRLSARFPSLCSVGITGHPTPHENVPGHDLTYVAEVGLLDPPKLPLTLIADLAGAERAVTSAVALLLGRSLGTPDRHARVALTEAAADFGRPLRFGITAAGGVLGGGFAGYGIYRARDGWVAVAALEAHFWTRLVTELDLDDPMTEDLARRFAERDVAHWVAWAAERDLPIGAVAAGG